MHKEFDAIIIGGGPGGLAPGCLLAREGLSTLIIEKDAILGGRYRSIDFHGCRADSGCQLLVAMEYDVEKTFLYRLLSDLGIPLEYKIIPWTMTFIGKDRPGDVDIFAMKPELGPSNFFEFFGRAVGSEMADSSKEELLKVFNIFSDYSQEECRKLVNIPLSEWLGKNVEDPIVVATISGMDAIAGCPVNRINLGQIANFWGKFAISGCPRTYYPRNGTVEDAIITPLTKYYTDHGGQVLTDRTVREIIIEDDMVKGVVALDHRNRFMVEEYSAPIVICAIPVFEAVAKGVLRNEHLPSDLAEAVKCEASMADPDITGFFLLREEIIPHDSYPWVHIFDTDYDIPTYVGDYFIGAQLNSPAPRGKQLIKSLIVGSTPSSQFGVNPPMKTVWKAWRKWHESIEKAYPGFNKAIEYEAMNLQLNFSRYSYAVVPTEIDIQSPNIQGLYFGGDSIRAVGDTVSGKCYENAFALHERVMQYVRSKP